MKTRIQDKADDAKQARVGRAHAVGAAGRAHPLIPLGIMVAALGAVGVVVWWRRR